MFVESPTFAEVLQKRSYVDTLRQKAALKTSFGLAFYEPHHKQDLFHRASEYKSRFWRSGNRGGKSLGGAAEDASWALGYRPFYQRTFNVLDGKRNVVRVHDPVRDAHMIHVGIPQRNVKGLIIVADWDKAEEIFTCQNAGESKGKLFKLLPDEKIVDVIKNQSGKICTVLVESIWGGVSSINLDTIKSYKANPMGQESSDWDFLHIDEPCPKDMWKANARGLIDRDGSEWFTCTPLTEMWINDYFLPDGNIKDDFEEPCVHEVAQDEERILRWIVTGSMHDNPVLTASSKAKFISTLTEDERETRVEGRPAELAGAVYKEFKQDVHIYREVPLGWTDYDEPPANYCLRIAIDTHPSTPHATLFAATAPTGHTFFFAELFEKSLITPYCNSIRAVLNGRWPLRQLLELAAYNVNPVGEGITIADEFLMNGLQVEPASKDLSYGILRVRQELNKRDNNGHPFLLFSPYLRETLREFDRYVWDEEKGKPVDRDDHMMECLYRLVLTGLEYVEPTNDADMTLKPMDMQKVAQVKLPDTKPLSSYSALTMRPKKLRDTRYQGDFVKRKF